MAQSIIDPKTNAKNLEGVVAMKALSNNLLAVVYTNGLLRVFVVSSTSILVETNLIDTN